MKLSFATVCLLLLSVVFATNNVYGFFETYFYDVSTQEPSKHYCILSDVDIQGGRFAEWPSQRLFEGNVKTFGFDLPIDSNRLELSFTYRLNDLPFRSRVIFNHDQTGVTSFRNFTTLSTGMDTEIGIELDSYFYKIVFFFRNDYPTYRLPFYSVNHLNRKYVVFEFVFHGWVEQRYISVEGISESLLPKTVSGQSIVTIETKSDFNFELMFEWNDSVYVWATFECRDGWVYGRCHGNKEQYFSMATYELDEHFVDVHFFL
ncbi:hypothetical protein RCL1_002263 [Eukaryota sp. TZLM3-RCL]